MIIDPKTFVLDVMERKYVLVALGQQLKKEQQSKSRLQKEEYISVAEFRIAELQDLITKIKGETK